MMDGTGPHSPAQKGSSETNDNLPSPYPCTVGVWISFWHSTSVKKKKVTMVEPPPPHAPPHPRAESGAVA
jgi:hypothetical protein